MKKFLDNDFLLTSQAAVYLYEKFAKDQPVIDYHCHLNPKDIADDRNFQNLTEAWLHGDHYKWRAMRANGIPEEFCTGQVGDYEKFEKWAMTVPFTLRNPLYHWTHLELRRYFDIIELLDPRTARDVYDRAGEMLRSPEFSVRNLLKRQNVKLVCTTDDPADTLEYHRKIAADGFGVKVLPAWRPDRAMAVDQPVLYAEYLGRLEAAAGMAISTFDDLLEALRRRHDYFHQCGCRLSDHGLDRIYAKDFHESEVRSIFAKIRRGAEPDHHDVKIFKSAMLYHLAIMDHEKGWVQQYHTGALRNNNTAMMTRLGPDTGFDSMGNVSDISLLACFLDRLYGENKLAKTILYNLNPSENEAYATMTGNFQDGVIPGKIQWGAAWWFLDQKTGIERHLDALSSMGLLSRFVGMLTDSRSFLSFPRHEYFRRILCGVLGREMERGELPDEPELIGNMVRSICYGNARNYFPFWDH